MIANLTGQKFGRWTVIEADKTKQYYWVCSCECGTRRLMVVVYWPRPLPRAVLEFYQPSAYFLLLFKNLQFHFGP